MDPDLELKIRVEYAWKWFEFHAQQRTTMFNFFIIFMGIIGKGIFDLINSPSQHQPWLASYACFFGFFVSLGFMLLDHRNQTLVNLARDVLRNLEGSHIFHPSEKSDTSQELPVGIILRDEKTQFFCRLERHRIWIPIIQGAVGLSLLLLGIFSRPSCH